MTTIDSREHHRKTTNTVNSSTVRTEESVGEGSAEEPEDRVQARDTGLYLIGLFKLAKAIFFMSLSLGALHFVHHDLSATVNRIIRLLHFDPESRLVDLVTDKVALITHHKLRLFSMGTFLYSALCTTEAYGLLRRKVWAEFVTLWLSVSFIPWELWELARRATPWHFTILAANLLIVAYLLWMLRRRRFRRARPHLAHA